MKKQRQQGFTLIEILVAVLVFGLGVLGVAALGATSQKASLKAYHSMLATWKAQEMMESIRANRDHAVTSNDYLHAPTDSAPNEPGKNCIQTFGETLAAAGCSSADLAADDLYEWIESLAGYLPSASGTVSAAVDSITGLTNVTVTVLWDAGDVDQNCGEESHGYASITVNGRACQAVRFGL